MEFFDRYTREEWQSFKSSSAYDNLTVSRDYIKQAEIAEVYAPLLEFIGISIDHIKALNYQQQAYLRAPRRVEPFVIGISGGVSVGKSTVAAVLRDLLRQVYPQKQVELMNTDGFLYPNQYLIDHGILDRKGFPESYDMEALKAFVNKVRQSDGVLEYPIYSHEIYDIVPDSKITMHQPNILIVEGVVVLQTPENPPISVRDFFDFSIYVDAEFENVFEWFNHRYDVIFDRVKDDPSSFYYEMAHWTKEETRAYAHKIWDTINTPNLEQHIAPTKDRADLILHKTKDHYIDNIYVRKF